MRYWVYINDKVIEKPFEEGELASIPGFDANTLVCKETPAEGESQEWMPAKTLIESYKQPAPPPPPNKQTIEKFASKEDSAMKESQATILSSNIFGSDKEKQEVSVGNKEAEAGKTNFTQTEAILPQEQASFEEEMFSEPTEVVSIDDVKEIDVDNQTSVTSENEEEILKTAIRSVVVQKPIKKENGPLQAIDIANNKNIDLSDPDEEKEEKIKTEESVKREEDNTPQEQTNTENKEEPAAENLANTELTLLGASKTGINHLFDLNETDPSIKSEKVEDKQEVKPSDKPLNEEEFLPEEEISLEDDDFVVEDLNKDKDVITQEGPSVREQEVLQELIEDKEADLRESQEEEKELEEAFKTSPALIADLPQENKKEEILPEKNDILETKEEIKSVEDIPTTLEELTGKFPLPQAQQTAKEEKKDEGFIPAEVHPDIIVEEVKEEGKEEAPAEDKEKKDQPEMPLDKDNFLTTFSSDIETVFLDQPTAFISDYIPPEETSNKQQEEQQPQQKDNKEEILDIKSSQGQHQVSLQNVRRVKPAAIKTVPMVDGEQVDPFSKTQIRRIEVAEEAQAQIEKKNNIMNLVNTFALIIIFLLMLVGFLGLIAQIGIMPKDFSPLHAMFTKGDNKETKEKNTNLTPEELALRDLKEAEELRINKIISEVKSYKLMEGITLEEKIKLLHPNVFNTLKWEAAQLPADLTYYSVTVSSPTNPEGYAQVNYRFNYNTVNYSVEATTSEANNVMVNPYEAPTK